jgi:hypothetical protein
MQLIDLINKTIKELTIIGTIPISEKLVSLSDEIHQAILQKHDLHINVFYESDNDLFYQSLSTDTRFAKNRISFAKLKDSRKRVSRLAEFVTKHAAMPEDKKLLAERLQVKQVNLRLPLNVIRSDKELYICPVLSEIPSEKMYHRIESNDAWHALVTDYIDFYIDEQMGGIYQSGTSEEMLVMYDKENIPRGIFPRKAFYNTDFQRYSVWLFIFNRKGELLLHKRSMNAADNWGLWDKSAGGHVDIADVSTSATAERELVEELILPKGEFTKYLRDDPHDFINMGVWKPDKRADERALSGIHDFDPHDWAYFHSQERISRTSKRRYRLSDSPHAKTGIKETKFISDVFLFIAPAKILDDNEAVKKLSREVSSERTLKTIPEIIQWIEDEKSKGNETEVFTDDLLYIMDYMRDMLEEFSEVVKVTFSK